MHPAAPAPARPGRQARPPASDVPAPAALPWFAGVATAYTVAQLLLVVPDTGLGWDETVYVSQVAPHTPAAFFSAPRARGVSLLVAPVVALTDSTDVLRLWLAVVSGCGLLLALWPWRRLVPVPLAALAGLLFCGLWMTLFYGPQAMPNLWVAFGALAATGWFLCAVRGPGGDRRALVALAASVAFTALMRPGDGLSLLLPLAGAAVCVRSWRRPVVLLAVVGGALAGGAEWVVEAYLHYGGLAARLARASQIQGGWGAPLALDDHMRALEGRALCRPCTIPWRHPVTAVWWFAVPPLTAGGLLVASRVRRPAVYALPVVVALSMAVPYQFLDYAAPRFLLPAYGLLALPVTLCLLRLVTTVEGGPPRLRPVAAAALVMALLAHLAVQYVVLGRAVARSAATDRALGRIVTELRRQGLRPPCAVTGTEAVRIAFRAGCASRQTDGHDANTTVARLVADAARQPVAVVTSDGTHPPPYARTWRAASLPALPGEAAGLHARLSPPARR
ncbi:hypothetical protein [Streptomyces sp. NPDC049555]|uniref:hypothetical protein n=1 Tax=Streptomyces sp. NPDC049555 TaxID=3154930 RepID=UPI00342EAF55